MNAPPFPANPRVNQASGNWVWNGSRWVCTKATGLQIITTVIADSGPYTPSAGLMTVVAETVGGGGQGGFCVEGTDTLGGGGGGGSGGYSKVTLAAALVLGGVNVVVGTGGTGASVDVANDGTPTSFGAFCIANGGSGGSGNDSDTTWGEPGAGAVPGVGDVALPGNPGTPGTSQNKGTDINVVGGGGGAIWGGAGLMNLVGMGGGTAGSQGLGPGAGGSGAAVNLGTLGYDGGNGGDGLCVVTEYCWGDGSDSGGDCGCGPARVEGGWPPCPPGGEHWDD